MSALCCAPYTPFLHPPRVWNLVSITLWSGKSPASWLFDVDWFHAHVIIECTCRGALFCPTPGWCSQSPLIDTNHGAYLAQYEWYKLQSMKSDFHLFCFFVAVKGWCLGYWKTIFKIKCYKGCISRTSTLTQGDAENSADTLLCFFFCEKSHLIIIKLR